MSENELSSEIIEQIDVASNAAEAKVLQVEILDRRSRIVELFNELNTSSSESVTGDRLRVNLSEDSQAAYDQLQELDEKVRGNSLAGRLINRIMFDSKFNLNKGLQMVEQRIDELIKKKEWLLKYTASFETEIENEKITILTLGQCYDDKICLLYTSPSPRDATLSRMPSSA